MRISSNTSMGNPPGFARLQHERGTAPRTGLCDAFGSWRPMYRATSPPPVECPMWIAAQIEGLHEFGQIVRIGVHVVAEPRLARTSMAAAVMCDAPEAVGSEKQHLVFPGVGGEGPAMTEDYRLAFAPVFEVELDRLRILLTDNDSAHRVLHVFLMVRKSASALVFPLGN